MKCLLALSLLPSASLAFQQAVIAPSHHHKTALHFFPDNFERAQECATHLGTCHLEEMEKLADGMCNAHESVMSSLHLYNS